MSYQVLARKWRPRVFSELVGQGHVVKALSHALDRDQLHPAILLSGTRGVGKTTLGRILAKSLNCEKGVSSSPCGVCSICIEVDQGRHVDLLEVDAASNTGVDDVRQVIENAQYSPARGRYKIYLIDEVHMLSRNAFNALLKTLEEPPAHVKFLLATTDPNKLPITVLSRCLQFHLRQLPVAEIRARLQKILEAEKIAFDAAALQAIARAAGGSLRDALSLLDQAIAFGSGQVQSAEVQQMLGGLARRDVLGLLQKIAAQDARAALEKLAALDELAPDYGALLEDLAGLLLDVAKAQQLSELHDAEVDEEELQAIKMLAGQLSPEDVQLFYQMAINGRRDLAWAPDPRAGAEMTVLRMLAFHFQDAPPTPGKLADPRPASPRVAASATPVAQPLPAVPTAKPASAPAAAPVNTGNGDWAQLVGSLTLGQVEAQLLRESFCESWQGDQIRLRLPTSLSALLNERRSSRIQAALAERLGRSVRLQVEIGELPQGADTLAARASQAVLERQRAAETSILQDPLVRDLQQRFDAKVPTNTIEPLD